MALKVLRLTFPSEFWLAEQSVPVVVCVRLYFALVCGDAAGQDCFFKFLDVDLAVLVEVEQIEHVVSRETCWLGGGFLSL